MVAQGASTRNPARRRQAIACSIQGVICDQDSIATATVLTFTGTGLAYNGVPLLVTPPSNILVLSSDPSCTTPGSSQLTFPPVSPRGWLSLHLVVRALAVRVLCILPAARLLLILTAGPHQMQVIFFFEQHIVCSAAAPTTGPTGSSQQQGPNGAPTPITPLQPINILDGIGRPLHVDNATSFAYISSTGGTGDPSAMFIAYRPANPYDATPIQPGEALQLQSQQTGKYCRLADLPAGLVSPPACNTQGLICDQSSLATATVLTFTGTGLAYTSVPLAAMQPSNTLALSLDPSCASPGSTQLTFPPAFLCKRRGVRLQLLSFASMLALCHESFPQSLTRPCWCCCPMQRALARMASQQHHPADGNHPHWVTHQQRAWPRSRRPRHRWPPCS